MIESTHPAASCLANSGNKLAAVHGVVIAQPIKDWSAPLHPCLRPPLTAYTQMPLSVRDLDQASSVLVDAPAVRVRALLERHLILRCIELKDPEARARRSELMIDRAVENVRAKGKPDV